MSQNVVKHSYRKDIDGLRAIAVLSIIFYHFGLLKFFGGGFVGVDIFFVISGYLITKILYIELKDGVFSFLDFYERRLRRIIPAFAIMLFVSFLVGTYLFTGDKYTGFIKSMLASLVMLSNFYFWRDGGYFDDPAHTKPLIHTWSLSIEEQFYLFFPLLLWILFSKRKYLLPSLYVIFSISFILAVIFSFLKPNSAFFLPFTRVWELLMGGILAIHTLRNDFCFKKSSSLFGYIGLLLIVISIIGYGHINNLVFPGLAAFLPCLGTTLCILSGSAEKENFVVKFLSNKVFVITGLLSYSLYLWHWPIYVFYKEYNIIHNIQVIDFIYISCLTILLSVVSYHFIEKPFRKKLILHKRTHLWATFVIYFSFFIVIGAFFYKEGNTFLLGTRSEFVINNRDIVRELLPNNKVQVNFSELNSVFFRFGAREQIEPTVLLMGDSHARMFWKSFDDWGRESNISGILHTSPHPLLGMYNDETNKSEEYDKQFKQYVLENNFEYAILAMRFASYINGPTDYENPNINVPLMQLFEKHNGRNQILPNEVVLRNALVQTIEFFQHNGIKVFLVEPIPEMLNDIPDTAVNLLLHNDVNELETLLRVPRSFYLERQERVLPIIEAAKGHGANIIDTVSILCDEEFCYGVKNGKALYYDDDHLSIYGTSLFKDSFSFFVKE